MSRKAFDKSLHNMHNALLRMGSKVEKQLRTSIESLEKRDIELAKQVVKEDDKVDDMQKEIENMCISLIAMEHPLASDLRDVFSGIKIATDLERMGDHAVDIAKITKRISADNEIEIMPDLVNMTSIVIEMIKGCLDAYIDKNLDKCYEIANKDNQVDDIYKKVFKDIFAAMDKDKSFINEHSQFLFVCKYLERLGDRCTNICESTIYLITGKIEDLNE
ncbi:Phosphate-specific transport system accessory protein PhoU homolog [Clostridium bornimense]|uniref:Phosphate-specific transport system accessory protein PhoU n=1 Tax=Clostridium bornimense TaxID=1216932 RepID=W6RZQ0_9CLOT|nr:phosphate signaling complex protein PhoU [Clostridium bornimense]CDM69094.1 Phosphate-specific transport system accessory protein PhoU homolog [Clostridium bornimense]